jgi:hypothetical protein
MSDDRFRSFTVKCNGVFVPMHQFRAVFDNPSRTESAAFLASMEHIQARNLSRGSSPLAAIRLRHRPRPSMSPHLSSSAAGYGLAASQLAVHRSNARCRYVRTIAPAHCLSRRRRCHTYPMSSQEAASDTALQSPLPLVSHAAGRRSAFAQAQRWLISSSCCFPCQIKFPLCARFLTDIALAMIRVFRIFAAFGRFKIRSAQCSQ